MTSATTPVSPGFHVLVVCADPTMRAELHGLIAALEAVSIDAAAESGLVAARLCSIARPDAVVLDVIDSGAVHDVLGIASASPSSTIIVFTARSDRRTTARLVGAGAADVVAKGDGADLHHVLSRLVSERAA